jgi:serralysin
LLVSELIVPEDDFSDALDDSKVIGVWERLDAFIEQPGDIDTIAVSLEAGTAVDITVYGNDNGLYGELRGAEIRAFVDADGVDIDSELFDKVKGFGNFIVEVEQITYTPPTTGLYFLTVGSNSGVGDYSVAVGEQDKGIYGIRAHEPFVFTGLPEIDAVYDPQSVDFFNNDHIVSDRDDDGIATLTYSLLSANSRFSESFHHPIASAPTVDFEPASGIVLDTFMSVMESISGFANIEFVEVPDDGVQAGNFRMGFSGLLVGGPGFLANGWSGFARWAEFGETWINPTQTALNIQGTTIELDNFLVNRTLHEFSHNLGLAHPDRSPNFASDIDPALSGQEYSVMSRTSSGTFPGAFGDLWPQTLMWFDIQAIQAAYGVAGDATGGDNTYTVDTERRHFSTIWDMAGNDTLVLTGNADTSVDLTPGTWQDVGTTITYFRSGGVVGTRTETIFIAPDTIIENVVAGSGNDKITGNSADNHLDGGAGRDVLIGGPGDDVLKGGSGADTFQFLSTADGNNVIRDFSTDDDVINLDHPLDALGTDAGARGVVLSEDSRGNTLLNIDINGDGAADRPEFSITLQDVVRADFVAAMTLDRKIILYK